MENELVEKGLAELRRARAETRMARIKLDKSEEVAREATMEAVKARGEWTKKVEQERSDFFAASGVELDVTANRPTDSSAPRVFARKSAFIMVMAGRAFFDDEAPSERQVWRKMTALRESDDQSERQRVFNELFEVLRGVGVCADEDRLILCAEIYFFKDKEQWCELPVA